MSAFLRDSRITRKAATLLVILLLTGASVYSLLFLWRGVLTVLPGALAGPPTLPPIAPSVFYRDNLIPFLAAILMMASTSTGKAQAAWLGLATLVILLALFVFSPGGPQFVPEVILLVLVTVISIIKRASSKSI